MNHLLQIILFTVSVFATGSFDRNVTADNIKTDIVESISIFDGDRLSIYVSHSDHRAYFNNIKYIQSDDQLNMVTFEEIRWIQITNTQGELIFRIPVESKDLNISLNSFEPGMYHLQMLFGDDMKQIVSDLVIKEPK